jgi:hypothetical protein
MEIDLHEVGIPLKVGLRTAIPESIIPKELITGDLRDLNGSTRCRLEYKEAINHGTYGYIQRILRNKVPCVCKRPLRNGDSFVAEAIIQLLAYRTLNARGVHAIPKVLDIYRYVSETRFTMEFIRGRSALEEIYEAVDPDTTLLQILAQTSLLLAILEEDIHMDHRDLKMTNLWIRKTPINYTVRLGSKVWHIVAPFQVVILDFGFACIGDGFGNTVVNLGDVIPDLDPCPKDGRDLYQCIMSLLSVEKVTHRLSSVMQETLKGWVGPIGSLTVTYLITSHPRFSIAPLRPLSLLKTLSSLGHISFNEA